MRVAKFVGLLAAALLLSVGGPAGAQVFKIATLTPEGSTWMEKMTAGAEELARRTQNRVQIKYYPGGVMGDDKAVLRKIRIGQLHGGALIGGSLSQFFTDNQIYALPLEFRSLEELDYVRRHLDQRIMEGLEKGGFVTFGIAEGGFAYVMSTVPIHSVEDMRQQRVWIPDNDSMIVEAIKAFEINPIPLSIADVRAGLQTGLINTVTTPPIGALTLQWHTQIKYLMDEPFLYIYGLLAIDRDVFYKLTPADQQAFREVMGNVFKELDRQNRIENVKALEALRNQGIQFVKPSAEALAKWHRDADTVPERLIRTGRLSADMVATLNSLLKTWRSSKGGARGQ